LTAFRARFRPVDFRNEFEGLLQGDQPILALAPMQDVTDLPFWNLMARYGGADLYVTEYFRVYPGSHLNRHILASIVKNPTGQPVVAQMIGNDIPSLVRTARELQQYPIAAVDLNLGCPAPRIQAQASGCALYRDFAALSAVLREIRRHYAGTLTVKVRLGDDPDHWREGFTERLRLFEDCGVHAVTVHPRFSFEKLKRRARWHEFPWIAAQTALPIIGNGDICCPDDIAANRPCFEPLAGLMLGRIAAVKPWIFREFAGLPRLEIDHLEVWNRLYRYTLEDMPADRAFGRLKEFTFYFAKNFFFGHEMFKGIQKARNAEEIREAANRFLEAGPRLNAGGGVPFT
jgi:tRNA-dihydrouridine synthase B